MPGEFFQSRRPHLLKEVTFVESSKHQTNWFSCSSKERWIIVCSSAWLYLSGRWDISSAAALFMNKWTAQGWAGLQVQKIQCGKISITISQVHKQQTERRLQTAPEQEAARTATGSSIKRINLHFSCSNPMLLFWKTQSKGVHPPTPSPENSFIYWAGKFDFNTSRKLGTQ